MIISTGNRPGPSPLAEGDERVTDLETAYGRAIVLIVDDNRVNRHLLSALLQRGGISRIEIAIDGYDALAKLEESSVDLILLDLMMPGIDGFEVCQRLRADARFADLPVLVQSSLNRPEDRARAFAAGATDYVSKPINATELLARVRIHLQNRILLRRLQNFRRRTEIELTLAREMQSQLMPQPVQLAQLADSHGVRLEAHFEPSSELGGDFWDLRVDQAGRVVLWLVDFSGHGVGAAFNTFRLHAILKTINLADFDPTRFLETVNRRLCGLLPSGQFATMLAGVIDPTTNRFRFASAASTKPMVWTPGASQPQFGDSDGLPLGLLASATYEARELPMPPGGWLFLYSDAAIELPVGTGVLDEPGLAELVADTMGETEPAKFLTRLVAGLESKGEFDDDLTALVAMRAR